MMRTAAIVITAAVRARMPCSLHTPRPITRTKDARTAVPVCELDRRDQLVACTFARLPGT